MAGDVIAREETPDSHGYPVVTLRNYGAGETPDVTVIAYGGMSRLLVPLLERLAGEEIRLLACLPACISPLDAAPLVAAARQSGRVLVVEESPVAFRLGGGGRRPDQRAGRRSPAGAGCAPRRRADGDSGGQAPGRCSLAVGGDAGSSDLRPAAAPDRGAPA